MSNFAADSSMREVNQTTIFYDQSSNYASSSSVAGQVENQTRISKKRKRSHRITIDAVPKEDAREAALRREKQMQEHKERYEARNAKRRRIEEEEEEERRLAEEAQRQRRQIEERRARQLMRERVRRHTMKRIRRHAHRQLTLARHLSLLRILFYRDILRQVRNYTTTHSFT
ncbi:hypothetical protein K501DRAFT_281699 [Backusella circina FSU 941]|nr:hypothetical protein K501DRAFT_281699 [Backusella circina FSU 941]